MCIMFSINPLHVSDENHSHPEDVGLPKEDVDSHEICEVITFGDDHGT